MILPNLHYSVAIPLLARKNRAVFFAGSRVSPKIDHGGWQQFCTGVLAARAQQGERPRRVGVQTTSAENDYQDQALLGAFRNKLAVFGWIEGQNVEFVYRRTMASTERAEAFASEWAGLQADVVPAVGGTATSAVVEESLTVPGVFVTDTYPVAAGFVASLDVARGQSHRILSTHSSAYTKPEMARHRWLRRTRGKRPTWLHLPRRAVNSRRLMHLYPRPSGIR